MTTRKGPYTDRDYELAIGITNVLLRVRRRILRATNKYEARISYSELCETLEKEGYGCINPQTIGNALGLVMEVCTKNGLPPLNVLAVFKNTGSVISAEEARNGFFHLYFALNPEEETHNEGEMFKIEQRCLEDVLHSKEIARVKSDDLISKYWNS